MIGEQVAHRVRGLVAGVVGELRPTGDIADRVDVRLAGLEQLVDRDASPSRLYAGVAEVQRLDVRRAADGDEDLVDTQFTRARADQVEHLVGAVDVYRADLRVVVDLDALGGELPLEDGDQLGIVARDQVRPALDDGDLGPQPAERLRELDPDWPPPTTASRLGRSARSNACSLVGTRPRPALEWLAPPVGCRSRSGCTSR